MVGEAIRRRRLPSGLVVELRGRIAAEQRLVDTDRKADFDAWFAGADFGTPDTAP